jgi:hypothetical protein
MGNLCINASYVVIYSIYFRYVYMFDSSTIAGPPSMILPFPLSLSALTHLFCSPHSTGACRRSLSWA